MNFLKKIFILIFIILTATSFITNKRSLEDKNKIVDFLKKSKNYYVKNNHFKVNTEYNLFLGNSKKATESYKGFFIKNNKNYYTKVGETELIITSKNTIKIDNEEKLMQCFSESNEANEVVYDLLKYCDNFGTFNLSSNKTDWICTLNSREFTFIPYSKIIIYLSKFDYSITKQELFLISPVKTKDKNGKEVSNYPKLEITFSDMVINVPTDEYFKINNYIELKKGKYYPSKKYKSYQIVD